MSDVLDATNGTWLPKMGPMEWEHDVESRGIAWEEPDRTRHTGIIIRTKQDRDEWIASDEYVNDLENQL